MALGRQYAYGVRDGDARRRTAHAARQDPVAYRMARLSSPEHTRHRQRSHWPSTSRATAHARRPPAMRGVAMHETAGTVVAYVTEVSIEARQPRVHRDGRRACRPHREPTGAEAQIQAVRCSASRRPSRVSRSTSSMVRPATPASPTTRRCGCSSAGGRLRPVGRTSDRVERGRRAADRTGGRQRRVRSDRRADARVAVRADAGRVDRAALLAAAAAEDDPYADLAAGGCRMPHKAKTAALKPKVSQSQAGVGQASAVPKFLRPKRKAGIPCIDDLKKPTTTLMPVIGLASRSRDGRMRVRRGDFPRDIRINAVTPTVPDRIRGRFGRFPRPRKRAGVTCGDGLSTQRGRRAWRPRLSGGSLTLRPRARIPRPRPPQIPPSHHRPHPNSRTETINAAPSHGQTPRPLSHERRSQTTRRPSRRPPVAPYSTTPTPHPTAPLTAASAASVMVGIVNAMPPPQQHRYREQPVGLRSDRRPHRQITDR